MLLVRFFLIIILFIPRYAGAFDHSRYEDGEIDDICNNYIKLVKDGAQNYGAKKLPMEIFTNGKAYKMKLKFLGEVRSISNDNRSDLLSFDKALPDLPAKATEISTKEILVSAKSGKNYWMPIQDVLVSSLQAEVEKNKEFYGYVISIMHHIDNSYKCSGTYLINEFQVVTAEGLKQEKIKGLYSKGQLLMKDRKFNEAESVFNEIIKISPNHDDALSNICLIAQNRDQFEKALECYDKVIGLDANAYEAFFSKGLILSKQQKANDSIREFDRAIVLMTEQKLPPYVLANAYYLRANSKLMIASADAINDLEKARELNPNRVSQEQIEEVRKRFVK